MSFIWRSLLLLIIGIADKLLRLWEHTQRRRDHERRQEKRDQAVDNPGNSFANHFGGRVRDVSETTAQANKTGPDDRDPA